MAASVALYQSLKWVLGGVSMTERPYQRVASEPVIAADWETSLISTPWPLWRLITCATGASAVLRSAHAMEQQTGSNVANHDPHGELPSRRHLIITGTGRAGTTLLVQLMTELGMDTGFTDISSGIFPNAHAGMELDLREPGCPYVVKDPRLCERLGPILREGLVTVDHAIVPIRDLFAAAESRRSISTKAGIPGGSTVAGGLWLTDNPEDQEVALALQLYQLFHTLARYDIPTTTLDFPRFVSDHSYLYRKLSPLMPNVTPDRFRAAFETVVRPELVHDFEAFRSGAGPPSGE